MTSSIAGTAVEAPGEAPSSPAMVPSLGTELSNEPALFEQVWSWGTEVLKLDKAANGVAPAPLPVESGADIVAAAAE